MLSEKDLGHPGQKVVRIKRKHRISRGLCVMVRAEYKPRS